MRGSPVVLRVCILLSVVWNWEALPFQVKLRVRSALDRFRAMCQGPRVRALSHDVARGVRCGGPVAVFPECWQVAFCV